MAPPLAAPADRDPMGRKQLVASLDVAVDGRALTPRLVIALRRLVSDKSGLVSCPTEQRIERNAKGRCHYGAGCVFAVTSTPRARMTANVVLRVGFPRSLNER